MSPDPNDEGPGTPNEAGPDLRNDEDHDTPDPASSVADEWSRRSLAKHLRTVPEAVIVLDGPLLALAVREAAGGPQLARRVLTAALDELDRLALDRRRLAAWDGEREPGAASTPATPCSPELEHRSACVAGPVREADR